MHIIGYTRTDIRNLIRDMRQVQRDMFNPCLNKLALECMPLARQRLSLELQHGARQRRERQGYRA